LEITGFISANTSTGIRHLYTGFSPALHLQCGDLCKKQGGVVHAEEREDKKNEKRAAALIFLSWVRVNLARVDDASALSSRD
jgi:hypothetical protein